MATLQIIYQFLYLLTKSCPIIFTLSKDSMKVFFSTLKKVLLPSLIINFLDLDLKEERISLEANNLKWETFSIHPQKITIFEFRFQK